MRLGDLDALSAFVGDLRSTLHKEQSTFKAMKQSEFEIKDNMLLNFQYAIDNAPTVESDYELGYSEGVHDTERPQGEWILDSVGVYCSECKTHPDYSSNFCPNCGADMRKGGAEE